MLRAVGMFSQKVLVSCMPLPLDEAGQAELCYPSIELSHTERAYRCICNRYNFWPPGISVYYGEQMSETLRAWQRPDNIYVDVCLNWLLGIGICCADGVVCRMTLEH